ncbi:PREDICTED: uncharacterized protein LOC104820537 [Tarenaya hassleriana]|uniref:uncharacterized protein LOC104820537 n=1 Tax=Tarenaya hassleriana TaxID=28532 RepID=UPI00053C4090|nr:PREDICTED: uncharacterized protein LOC104820537 [Tarenaya hassleriana]
MGREKFNNIAKITKLLVRLHSSPSFWLCLPTKACRSDITRRRKIIKLVRSDGSFEIYDRPVDASELMRDFPKHMVCRSDSLFIGQRTPSLSESDRLEPGHNYFLLPSSFFQNALSFVAISALNKNPKNDGVLIRNRRSSRNHRQPFQIQKGSNGSLRIRVSEDFLSELIMEGGDKAVQDEEDVRNSRVCTTVQLQKDYAQLVGSRTWKPKLETIKETKTKTRARVSKFLVMKRRSSKEKNHQSRPLMSEDDSSAKPRKVQSKSKSKSKNRIRKPICRK